MDFPLFTWLIACLGFFFGFFPLIAESQQKVNPPPPNVLHPPPHPHPPPLPPPPPPSPFVTIPPPQTPPPPSPFLPAPPPPPESQWLPHPSPRPPIPPSKKRLRPPPPNDAISKHRDHNHQYSLKNSTRTKPNNLNEGKKIGLIFVGVVAILQVCVVAILWIRRRQILNANGDY